ncbi:hypothetical protein HIM_00505 [Hirsutella minnesotensis 3608]|nr:hypothetical protein HIM_00505 [Hirsutella minnesotensis 3608]
MNTLTRNSAGDLVFVPGSRRRWSLSSVASRAGSRRSRASLSDASSTCSARSERQAACFAKAGVDNDCAFHLFMTWVAVKRNESARISPEEKLQCPFLQCRKSFPDHELMLLHLYNCRHRASGDYLCFDCGRAENLNDSKCRRCLGHPSKRRKMISMAKSFFTSLGQKSRSRSIDILPCPTTEEEPPSYDSVVAPFQVELQSTEIHEADSSEISGGFSDEYRVPYSPTSFAYLSSLGSMPPGRSPEAAPPAIELSHCGFEESLINWNHSSDDSLSLPRELSNSEAAKPPERPILQLDTRGLQYRKPRSTPRSKHLAPSSSVRSTASDQSTASNDISPMSAWSGCWSVTSGLNSTLTSPADDLSGLADRLPEPCSTAPFLKNPAQAMDFYEEAFGIQPAELAGDMSMPCVNPLVSPLPSDPVQSLSVASINRQPSSSHPPEGMKALLDGSSGAGPSSTQIKSLDKRSHVDAQTLGTLARNTVQVHIENSTKKLKGCKNDLVHRFCSMSSDDVIEAGLKATSNLLEGCQETSPVMLLCFLHVAYSLSWIVHQQDAIHRSKDFFSQALSYSFWLAEADRQAYHKVVTLLWEPVGFDGVSTDCPLAGPILMSRKGKERAQCSSRRDQDALILATLSFLDELEQAALEESSDTNAQSTLLYWEHIRDRESSSNMGSQLDPSPDSVVGSLTREYGAVPKFESTVRLEVDRLREAKVFSPRRLELGLMRAGKTRLVSAKCLDGYIKSVRDHMDLLYQQRTPQEMGDDPRLRYYRLDMRLLFEFMVQKPEPPTNDFACAFDEQAGLFNIEDHIMGDLEGFTYDPVQDTGFSVDAIVSEVAIDQPSSLASNLTTRPPDTLDLAAASDTWPKVTASRAEELPRKILSSSCCEICGYRPSGDPQWFAGSMARHKKRQHGEGPPTIYKCPFPGCASQFKSRRDNLKQHQLDKGHFVDPDDATSRTPSKRKKLK